MNYEVGDIVRRAIGSDHTEMIVIQVESDRVICGWKEEHVEESGIFNPWELKIVRYHE